MLKVNLQQLVRALRAKIGIILLFSIVTITACYNSSTIERMKEKETNQTNNSGRVLTIVGLEHTVGKVYVTFYESPRVFELNINTSQGKLYYKLLAEAKEKQLPVSVIFTKQEDNIICRVQSLTEEQMSHYLIKKNKRQKAVQVADPN